MTNEKMAQEIQNGNRDLTFALWDQVRPFARSRAVRYYRKIPEAHRVDLEDLEQESYIALTEAVQRYRPERGKSFIGYFDYFLKTAFAEQAGFRKRDALLQAVSIDAPVENEESETLSLVEVLEDPAGQADIEAAEEAIYTGQLHEALESALTVLEEDHRDEAGLIRQHYFEGADVDALAQRAGTDVKTIHRKKRDALSHLRHTRRCRKPLEEYIELATPWSWHSGVHVTEDIVVRRELAETRFVTGTPPLL